MLLKVYQRKRCAMPLCFIIAFAVWRDLILLSTVMWRLVRGLYQISWSPFPRRTKTQPFKDKISRTIFSYSAIRLLPVHAGKRQNSSAGGTGGTIHAKYHEDSTREDPMVIVWGVDISGKNYEKIIHLNDIDPRHATPAEMIALHAHLAQQDEQNMENPIALWVSKGMNVT